MRTGILRSFAVVFVLLVLGNIVSTAQESPRFISSSGPLDLYITENKCCAPIIASINDERPDPAVFQVFQNSSEKPVVGMVVVFSNGEWTRIHYGVFVRAKGSGDNRWVRNGFMGKLGENVKVAVDLILFEDGTTWGPDNYGGRVHLDKFRRGHELAVELMLKEAGGVSGTGIDTILKTSFGTHYAADVPGDGRAPFGRRSAFAIGYEGIVRALERGDEVSRAIASRIKAMPVE